MNKQITTKQDTELAAVRSFTCFCKESNDRGTTWIGVVEVATLQLQGMDRDAQLTLVKNLAREACASDWYSEWEECQLDSIACYCVIENCPEILYFEDLSE